MSFRTRHASLFFLPCVLAVAQSQTAKTSDKHGLEVFGGYSYLYFNIISSGGTQSIPAGSGFNGGVDRQIYGPLSGVGQVSVFPTSTYSGAVGTTFVFGPRYSFPVPRSFRVKPFAGAMIGGSTYTASDQTVYGNNLSFTYEFQGGLDYRLTPRFALRGEAEYVHSTLQSNTESGFAPSDFPHAQFDLDLVYRF